jgi:hypothetical protein
MTREFIRPDIIPRGTERGSSEICTSFSFSLIILDLVSFKCLRPFPLTFYFLNILFSCLFYFVVSFCRPVFSVFRVVLEWMHCWLSGRKSALTLQPHLILVKITQTSAVEVVCLVCPK